jgi:hypothetical protein
MGKALEPQAPIMPKNIKAKKPAEYQLTREQKELIKSKYARFRFPGVASNILPCNSASHLSMEMSNIN